MLALRQGGLKARLALKLAELRVRDKGGSFFLTAIPPAAVL